MSSEPITIANVPFLREVECDHVHHEYREEVSYGTVYFWKECVKCGHKWDKSYQEVW